MKWRLYADPGMAPLGRSLTESEKSWRVEIPLVNPSAVSRPMVRFAFARYQPYALDHLKMSEIFLAEYAQLSNDREVVITRDPKDEKSLHVSIYGTSFEGAEESGESRLCCWLERRCARQSHGESAWVEEGEPVPWQRTTREGRACWHGMLFSEDSLRCNRYRVAIAEEERFLRDLPQPEHGSIPVYFDLVPVDQIS